MSRLLRIAAAGVTVLAASALGMPAAAAAPSVVLPLDPPEIGVFLGSPENDGGLTVDTPAGTVDYTVTGTETYAKHELPGAADVWAIVPGRLVLITCFVDDDGRATDENFVVFADS